MTGVDADRPAQPTDPPPGPAELPAVDDARAAGLPDPRPAPRWRPDADQGRASGPPRTGRRLRTGCWVLVVILLLICCVLTAWGTDAVLDLRSVTTGG